MVYISDTDLPSVCAALVVPFTSLVQPVKVFVEMPVYVICSDSIRIVPVAVNPVTDASVIDVSASVMLPSSVCGSYGTGIILYCS